MSFLSQTVPSTATTPAAVLLLPAHIAHVFERVLVFLVLVPVHVVLSLAVIAVAKLLSVAQVQNLDILLPPVSSSLTLAAPVALFFHALAFV